MSPTGGVERWLTKTEHRLLWDALDAYPTTRRRETARYQQSRYLLGRAVGGRMSDWGARRRHAGAIPRGRRRLVAAGAGQSRESNNGTSQSVTHYAVCCSHPVNTIAYHLMIIATALEGWVDYLVSGDKKDLLSLGNVQNIPIIRPRQAVEHLGIVGSN